MNKIKEYLHYAYQSWIAIFVATIGFIGSLIAFIPQFTLSTTHSKIIALLLCLGLSIIVTLVVKPMKNVVENLSVDDIFFDTDTSSKILFPYQEKYLKPINVIANSYYGNVNPDLSVLRKWYEKNPYCLITLADSHNAIIGYYDILPLEETFAEKFITGSVTESNIESNVILSPKEMKNAKYIYFAGVAVKDYDNHRNRIYSGQLIYSAFIYLKKFYDLENGVTILAIATTNCGERLLQKLGYTLECSKYNRKDETDLYIKKVTLETIEKDRDRLALITNKIDYRSIITAFNENQKNSRDIKN